MFGLGWLETGAAAWPKPAQKKSRRQVSFLVSYIGGYSLTNFA